MKNIFIYIILFIFGVLMSKVYFFIMTYLSNIICHTIEQANMIDIIIILIYLVIYLPFILIVLKNIKKQIDNK